MIIGYLTLYVPCQIGDASTLSGPGLLNHGGTCRLQQICYHIYEIDTWHHWFRRSIRHKSWTSDASNKCGGWQLMWPFRFVAVPVCGRSGLWPFRFVAVPVCGRSGLWPFRFVAVSFCGRSGLWPFRFVAVSVVAVSVCGRYDLLPLNQLKSYCRGQYKNKTKWNN